MVTDWCATMWLPRPITHRSPIASRGMPQRSWPGTVPALIVTSWPMRVSSPTTIPFSPKTEPGGNAMIEPRPNRAKARPAGVSAVIRPACWNSRHQQCTARQSAFRLALLTRHLSLIHHVTGSFCRLAARGPTPRAHHPFGTGLGQREQRGAGAARRRAHRTAGDGRGQLAARAVDLAAAGVADSHRDAVVGHAADELLLDAGAGGGPLRAWRRVERDQVYVREMPC